MEEIRSKVNEVYGTDNVKNEENITKYYDIVDVEQEFGLLQNSDFIRKQVSFVDNKLYLAGDSVNVKLSKKGSIYFIIKNQIARGLVRNILLEKLVEYKYILDKEPVCELPQYDVYIASNDKYKLLVWINKHTNLYTLVYDYEAGLKILHNQKTKVVYNKLREEQDTHPASYKVRLREPDEIYGKLPPEHFTEKVEELEEVLSLILSIKQRRYSVEEYELLKEIKSELEIIL